MYLCVYYQMLCYVKNVNIRTVLNSFKFFILKRTLEQSVEQYMMQQVGLHSKDELISPTTTSSPQHEISVEHKMIEQIQVNVI